VKPPVNCKEKEKMKTKQDEQDFMKILKRAMACSRTTPVGAATIVEALMANEEADLAQLYAYFLPKINEGRPRARLSWLKPALATDADGRKALRYLYSDGSRICATNGKVLNVCEFNDYFILEPGFYDTRLNRIPGFGEEITYPNIDRVIPKDTVSCTYNLSDLEVHYAPRKAKLEPIYSYIIGNVRMDRSVLATALRDRRVFTVTNSDAEHYQPIKIVGPFKDSYSVVMGMRR